MSRSSAAGSRTIYVGNLPGDTREREVEDLFHKFGRIVDIDLKIPPRPPGYAFVEFDDERDAEDAIKHRDGYDFDGNKIRVELAHGGSRGGFERGGFGGFGGRVGGRPPGAVSKRSEYRVTVTGLPASASWQDLKDHMRKAGDVCFAQVFRDGKGTMGIVDYTSHDDMKYAIKKLDDSEFKNPFSRGYIRVREDRSGGGRARSASRSHSRSYSRSSRSRSRSASRSKSPASRSRSNSPANRNRSPDRKRSPPSRSRSKSPAARPKSRSPPASESPRPAPSRSRSRSAAAASP